MEQDYIIVTERQGKYILDFSVNTNPLGVPPKIEQLCENFVSAYEFYPDPECNALRKALSMKYSVPSEFIYCGSGADDILYRLVFAVQPKKALILEPTFEEYGRALTLTGCEIIHFQLTEEQNFCLDIEHLLAEIDRVDILFLCNPNNPTGQLVSHDDMLKLLKKCEEKNTICVIDECFIEMLRNWKLHTVKQDSKFYHNLIVVDAFTKTYALPGVRLGFAVTQNRALLDKMKCFGQEFNVSTPAQWAGLIALSDKQYIPQTCNLVDKERNWLITCFCELGLRTFSSVANFILVKAPVMNFNGLLLERGIKTRDCSNFFGLSDRYCRFAVRRHEENESLIAILKEIKKEAEW